MPNDLHTGGTLCRAIGMDPSEAKAFINSISKGETFNQHGISSWTRDSWTLGGFAESAIYNGKGDGVPIVFRIKASTVSNTTADISPFSGFRNMESEVLMSAKQNMRATSIKRLDDTGSGVAYMIDVEPTD